MTRASSHTSPHTLHYTTPMPSFTRTKRVTDSLHDKVKARIFGPDRVFEPGYISSGSEHSAQVDDHDVVSPSLSDLLLYGNDDETSATESVENNDSDTDRGLLLLDSVEAVEELNRAFLHQNADLYTNVLVANVMKALELFSCVRVNKSIHRRNVMAFLRDLGYNAAVCKTTWESSGGLTAGNYEFIDVLRPNSSTATPTRYFIELDFAAEFTIARRTSSYERLLQRLPNVFVGKSEELKQVLKVMSDAARRSLKSRGLHIPPWRKHRFMQNKWLGPYKRTSNIFPASFSSPASSKQNIFIKCRSVGFDSSAAVNGRVFFPAATRTR